MGNINAKLAAKGLGSIKFSTEVYTKEEVDSLLGDKLDTAAVVAPSTSDSDAGKAADAKATGDALAEKLDKSGGTLSGDLLLDYYKLAFGGTTDVDTTMVMGNAVDEVDFKCGNSTLTLKVGDGGTVAKTSDIESALGDIATALAAITGVN